MRMVSQIAHYYLSYLLLKKVSKVAVCTIFKRLEGINFIINSLNSAGCRCYINWNSMIEVSKVYTI